MSTKTKFSVMELEERLEFVRCACPSGWKDGFLSDESNGVARKCHGSWNRTMVIHCS